MSIFDKFDEMMDIEELSVAVKELETNGSSEKKEFEKVPFGQYKVKIVKLEAATNSSGEKPCISIWYRIQEGEFINALIFANQYLNTYIGISYGNKYLQSLKSGMCIEFDGYSKYAKLIDYVFEDIKDKTYELSYENNVKNEKFPITKIT